MPELVFTEGFIEDARVVALEGKLAEIRGTIDLLGNFPELSSRNLPAFISQLYGDQIRKLVVKPFLVIYEYRPTEDAVYVLGLDHERVAW